MEFKRLACEDKQRFKEVIKKHNYQNAESSFTNLFLWSKSYQIERAFGEHAMYISFVGFDGEKHYLAPFLYDFDKPVKPALEELRNHIHSEDKTFCIKGVVKSLRDKIEAEIKPVFQFFDDRDNYEYIYLSEDLINLGGKKLHAKRNHINYFEKTFRYEYREYDISLKDECVAHIEDWVDQKADDRSLRDEIDVLHTILDDYDKLDVKGAVVLVNGRVEALTFGEALNKDTALIHIEKANPSIRGLYPYINREFVKREWADYKYINREEDMGIEGLRKAKLSYNPVYLVEKYSCSVDGDCDGI
ncbi:MAG: phosphatidylglycerol lysyltransferase domain-containing protein [Eubacteriales bacterium]